MFYSSFNFRQQFFAASKFDEGNHTATTTSDEGDGDGDSDLDSSEEDRPVTRPITYAKNTKSQFTSFLT
jgi:hypothetical protein